MCLEVIISLCWMQRETRQIKSDQTKSAKQRLQFIDTIRKKAKSLFLQCLQKLCYPALLHSAIQTKDGGIKTTAPKEVSLNLFRQVQYKALKIKSWGFLLLVPNKDRRLRDFCICKKLVKSWYSIQHCQLSQFLTGLTIIHATYKCLETIQYARLFKKKIK